ncbi:MAG: hypothetical protein AB1585_06100 [Thermodesulfobacteriota bacterium]
MRKLGMFAFISALVVAFALPAFAYTVEGAKGERFTMGGAFIYDIGYMGTDKNYNTYVDTTHGKTVDRTQFFSVLSQSSHIYGMYTVGDISANWVIATQSGTMSSNLQGSGGTIGNQKDNDLIDVFYGTYKFGNSYILAGKIGSTWTYFQGPSVLGYNLGTGSHINSIAFGSVYDNKYPQIRFGQQINKMFGYYVALVTTGTYEAGSGNTTLSYAGYPAIAAKATLNFGKVMVTPGMIYQNVKWDKLPAGWDSSMTAYHLAVPVRVAFGPFVGIFVAGYGKNDGGPTSSVSLTSESSYHGFQRAATGKIYDSTNMNAMIDLGFTFGPVTPHVYYAVTRATNKDAWKAGNDYFERSSYGVLAWYKLNNNLSIIPEISFYNYGTIPGSTAKTELGKSWLAGVQFRFSF